MPKVESKERTMTGYVPENRLEINLICEKKLQEAGLEVDDSQLHLPQLARWAFEQEEMLELGELCSESLMKQKLNAYLKGRPAEVLCEWYPTAQGLRQAADRLRDRPPLEAAQILLEDLVANTYLGNKPAA
jgi:hypothetical protein